MHHTSGSLAGPTSLSRSDDDHEIEEIPKDLVHLSPAEQQQRIKFRAAYSIVIGTILVLLLSDPFVGVLDEIGGRLVRHEPPQPEP